MKYKCWQCGNDVEFPDDFEPIWRVFCKNDICSTQYKEQSEKELAEYIHLKTIVAYKRALRIMENSATYMYEYQGASKLVLQEALDNPDLYQSSHEMICAMIFYEHCYEFESQKKIGKHSVDFYLPELKVVFEVDGYMHKYHTTKDNERDIFIRGQLGADWEVVRIGTKYIEQKPVKIIEAIEQMKQYKQQLRKQYGGILPKSFSKREDSHYKKILGADAI